MKDCMSKGRGNQRRPGIQNGLSKLTENQVKEIRSSTEGAGIIARRLGVTRECIYAVRKRKVWKHVV